MRSKFSLFIVLDSSATPWLRLGFRIQGLGFKIQGLGVPSPLRLQRVVEGEPMGVVFREGVEEPMPQVAKATQQKW